MDKTTVRIGFSTMALPGYFMGEEETPAKHEEGIRKVRDLGYEVIDGGCVYSPEEAERAGEAFCSSNVDCLVVLLATFVADYFITELTKACDRPVFLWALDRDVNNITMVCTPLISASMKNLGRDICPVSGELDDAYCIEKLRHYANAAMLKNRVRGMRIGYSGHKPEIMYSMAANEYLLDQVLGVTVVNMPIEDFYRTAEQIDPQEAQELWEEKRKCFGCVDVRAEDGVLDMTYYLAMKKQISEKNLKGYSLNCFPNLKAKICLPIAMLGDELIGSGCEGDLHATILMTLTGMMTGQAAFNGDFLQLDRKRNVITFSHCGAGALSLAGGCQNIRLQKSIETEDGIGVFYDTKMPGKVTLVNLMNGGDHLRLSVMCADSVTDESGYEGTPLALAFEGDVRSMPEVLARYGTGHHWIGMCGDYTQEWELFARMTGMRFAYVKPEK